MQFGFIFLLRLRTKPRLLGYRQNKISIKTINLLRNKQIFAIFFIQTIFHCPIWKHPTFFRYVLDLVRRVHKVSVILVCNPISETVYFIRLPLFGALGDWLARVTTIPSKGWNRLLPSFLVHFELKFIRATSHLIVCHIRD